ncbi:MAG TPA: MFS transporter [Acidocella sp.]|uniref:MFS transporter n=1 Tax=Acidocella sp. TaxID=50710 RepID=UPI002BDFAAF4|nr:MFS transporter [Acidocella sp.]HVE21212.1 MFS transporter [Acidocella sp.]
MDRIARTTASQNPVAKSALRKVVIASVIGNGLEWFDFVSYGYFATMISRAFFPTSSFLSIMLTFATFAIGFVVRPVGGIVLGAYADRHGRRRALSLLIGMMAFGTLTLGLTPSYATIGIAAPLIVIAGRIVQGISIGGEFASATALLVEYVPENRRMLFGSFQMSAQAVGRVFAAGIGLLVITAFPPATIHAWAWRLPFLIGALVGPFGFYIRYRLAESPEFQHLQDATPDLVKAPVRTVLSRFGVPLVCAFGLVIVGTANTYVWNNYLPVYVVRELHLPLWEDLFGVVLTSALDIFICMLGGWLADRVGAYRMFFCLTAVTALVSYPLFAYVLAGPSFTRLLEAQLVALTLFGLLAGLAPGMLASLFPVSVRSTGMAISYNVVVTIFGGFSPLTITWMIHATGSDLIPALYLIAAAFLSLAVVGGTRAGVRRRAALHVSTAPS